MNRLGSAYTPMGVQYQSPHPPRRRWEGWAQIGSSPQRLRVTMYRQDDPPDGGAPRWVLSHRLNLTDSQASIDAQGKRWQRVRQSARYGLPYVEPGASTNGGVMFGGRQMRIRYYTSEKATNAIPLGDLFELESSRATTKPRSSGKKAAPKKAAPKKATTKPRSSGKKAAPKKAAPKKATTKKRARPGQQVVTAYSRHRGRPTDRDRLGRWTFRR